MVDQRPGSQPDDAASGDGGDSTALLEHEQVALRERARQILGVHAAAGATTADGAPERFLAALRRTGASRYPVLALGLLVVVDEFQGVILTQLAPEISRSLGMSKGAIAALLVLKGVAATGAGMAMAAVVQNRPRRAVVALTAAFVWATVTIATGFVAGLLGLMAVMLLDGATTGSVGAVHEPLLMDSYPPDVRVRAFAGYRGANALGAVLAPLSIAILTAWAHLTWRGVFLAMGLMSLCAALFAGRLRDPGFGRWDTARVRELVRSGEEHDHADLVEQTELGFFEIVRRLHLIPTVRRMFVAYAVLGMMLAPLTTFLAFYLDERWGLGPGARGAFSAGTALAAIAVLALFGPRGERVFREDPARLVRLTAGALIAAVLMIAIGAVMPAFWLVVVFFTLAQSMIPALAPGFAIANLSIVPPNMRAHASALAGIYVLAVGGMAGVVLLGSIDRRFGIVTALMVVCVPGIIGGLVLATASTTIVADLDRMIDEVVEEEEISLIARRGGHLPLLAARHIDFAYGQVQVLFDCDFTVDDGEMVALLGVNGAGKSTLLRVASGLGIPSRGSVRLAGHDVTHLDAEKRVRLGISQIPGGKAVFGPLSVVDNLELYGYSMDRSKRSISTAIDEAFAAFPRLAERRNQAAQTLSGGEQQMLALSKALILQPRLLLIDELSLGLAPIIVGQLLDIVRTINERGTAVVLVEQSVNVALSLVNHAYFMEKGQIRFDGPAQALLAREDLLRAVFLEGTGAGAG